MDWMSTPGAKGVFRTKALRIAARPSGGGSGTYRILSSRPGGVARTGGVSKHKSVLKAQSKMEVAGVALTCTSAQQLVKKGLAHITKFRPKSHLLLI
eukprot:scaffold184433_cov19-Tisochrysis_lutea.AAC.2